MPISPIGAGDGRAQTWTFTTDTSVFLLTGVLTSAIAMHMQDTNNNNALYVCTGVWSNIVAGAVGPPLVPATAVFTPSPTDLLSTNPLGKPGLYNIYPVVTLSTGAVPMDGQLIQVKSEP
jgi:hypothetical protein